ncbi:hypothetical protein TgHK011_009153 [Trichoderma gracile]|nr:hypothetical protein TgHK011_009153 [Trichoderma gracile]
MFLHIPPTCLLAPSCWDPRSPAPDAQPALWMARNNMDPMKEPKTKERQLSIAPGGGRLWNGSSTAPFAAVISPQYTIYVFS